MGVCGDEKARNCAITLPLELTSQFSQPIIGINELHPERLRPLLISKAQQKRAAAERQLSFDFKDDTEQ